MKVLVVGGGGREHAIVDALTRSGRIDTIYCAPGNAGIAAQAECVPIRETEVEALRDFALAHNVTLTVVGPEAALAAGIVDCGGTADLRPDEGGRAHRVVEGVRQGADGQIRYPDGGVPCLHRV